MAETRLRLLLLSVGSLAAQNVIDGLGVRRERCVLFGANSVANAAGNFRCDTVHLVPPAASGDAYISCVEELIREEHPDLVIPGRDEDVLALAKLGEHSPDIRSVLLTGSVAAARIMNDKVRTARFAAKYALPFAPTAENELEALALARAHGLPLVGKPRSGNAGRGVVVLRSNAEIGRAFESTAGLIAQPYLDPPPNLEALMAPFDAGLPFFFSLPETSQRTVQIIVGPDGTVSQPFGWISTHVGGQTTQHIRCEDPALAELGRAYAKAAADEGWRGPLNVQLKQTPRDGLIAFEMNGRFTGGTAARVLMGFDEIAEVLRRFLPAMAFPSTSFESDVVQKYLTSYPVPREGVAALSTAGRWSRANED